MLLRLHPSTSPPSVAAYAVPADTGGANNTKGTAQPTKTHYNEESIDRCCHCRRAGLPGRLQKEMQLCNHHEWTSRPDHHRGIHQLRKTQCQPKCRRHGARDEVRLIHGISTAQKAQGRAYIGRPCFSICTQFNCMYVFVMR